MFMVDLRERKFIIDAIRSRMYSHGLVTQLQ